MSILSSVLRVSDVISAVSVCPSWLPLALHRLHDQRLRSGSVVTAESPTSMDALNDIVRSFRGEYRKTPVKIKVLDCFLVYAVVTGLVQFTYLLLVGSFPFNSFLAGFFSCVGFFVLTVCLRMQIDPANADFKNMSPERAFADYVLCNSLLHLVIWNFMG